LLFDPVPKSSRRDFFDREAEIERVKSLSSPITLVLGLRRTGKSSVIMISLNELGLPYIYVDLRKFEEKGFASYRDLVVELEREVNRLTGRFPGLLELLRRVEGVEVMGSGVRLRWGGRMRVTISSLLEALNDWAEDRVLVVIDEAQELINMGGPTCCLPSPTPSTTSGGSGLCSAAQRWASSTSTSASRTPGRPSTGGQ